MPDAWGWAVGAETMGGVLAVFVLGLLVELALVVAPPILKFTRWLFAWRFHMPVHTFMARLAALTVVVFPVALMVGFLTGYYGFTPSWWIGYPILAVVLVNLRLLQRILSRFALPTEQPRAPSRQEAVRPALTTGQDTLDY